LVFIKPATVERCGAKGSVDGQDVINVQGLIGAFLPLTSPSTAFERSAFATQISSTPIAWTRRQVVFRPVSTRVPWIAAHLLGDRLTSSETGPASGRG
jgi:hypothetical protein